MCSSLTGFIFVERFSLWEEVTIGNMLQLTDWMARLMKQSVRECWPSVTVLFALIDLLHAMTGCCSLRLVASLLAWLPSRRFRAELSAPSPSYVPTSFRSDRHAVPCCLVECASTRARFQCPNPCHLPNLTAADIPRDPRTCPVTCFDGFVQNITVRFLFCFGIVYVSGKACLCFCWVLLSISVSELRKVLYTWGFEGCICS